MKVTITEPRKLAEGQAKAVILVDNFLELAILEDRQVQGEKFEILSTIEDPLSLPEVPLTTGQKLQQAADNLRKTYELIQVIANEWKENKGVKDGD